MKKFIRAFLLLLALTVMFGSCEQTGEEATQMAVTTADMAEEIVPETSAEETAAEIPEETTATVTDEVTAEETVEVTTEVTTDVTTDVKTEVTTEVIPEVTSEVTTEAPVETTVEVTEATTEPPHEHLWGAWNVVSAPSCLNEGKEERTCTCGEREQRTVAAVGHSEEVVAAKSPTCTEEGLTEGKRCSVCGEVTVKQTVLTAVGHSEVMDDGTTPTCTEEGLSDGKHCAICGEVTVKQMPVAALGHSEVIDAGLLPTCTEEGFTEGKHCANCGTVTAEPKSIAAVGHNIVIDEARAPTCEKNGLTEGKSCATCGTVTVKRKVIAALGHNPVTDAAKAATCTETGLTKGSHCSVCNAVLQAQTVIKARGHREYGKQGKAATCTEEGLTDGRYCSRCNLVTLEQKVIPPLGHKETVDAGFAADCTKNGLSDGKHCTVCGYITIPQTVIKAPPHNIVDNACTVCKKVQPISGEFVNPTLGYITSEATEIVTDHMIFKLPANVYVMDDFVNIVNKVSAAMEQVSGMKFKANPNYCKYNGTSDRLYVNVIKKEGTEIGSAYASAMQGAVIPPCDIVDFFALIHESAHVLQYRQSGWAYCTWAMEGISTYTTYKTACYMHENYPELSIIVSSPDHSIGNYSIRDYSKLYEHSMEYWMENTFEYSGNNNYSIGFRFAWFLDEVYGDYTKWIYTYEEYRPYHSSGIYNNALALEEQVKAFKMAYGENVFKEFYAWLKQNEHKFVAEDVTDLREAREINFYPKFMADEWYALMERIEYRDLCVDLSGGNYYLTDYQDKNISSLKMRVVSEDSAVLHLYAADGTYIRTENITRTQEIDISGVYYIIFAGEGQIQRFEITGFN